MPVLHCVYPVIQWWAFGLIPLLGCCEQCCYGCANVSSQLLLSLPCNILRHIILFSTAAAPFQLPPALHRVCFLHGLANTRYFQLVLVVAVLMGVRWQHPVVVLCISLTVRDRDHLLMYLVAICRWSLERCLFKYLVHFLTPWFVAVVYGWAGGAFYVF